MQALLSPPLTRTDRHRLRTVLPWLLFVLVADLVLALFLGIRGIESDLSTKASAALAAAGYDNVTVDPLGRELILAGTLPAGSSPTAAEELVEALPGVRYALAEAQSIPSQQPVVIGVASTVALAASAGQFTLSGQVPNQELADQIATAAVAAYGSVTNQLTVSANAEPSDSIEALAELLPTLATIDNLDVSVTQDQWVLRGAVGSEAELTALVGAVTAAVPAAVIDNRLIVVDVAATAAALDELVAGIADGSVLFEIGSSSITAEGAAFLDQVADLLLAAPGVRVEIGGHTDDVGSETDNLALSTERAEAVAAHLVAAGVAPADLVAVGYGESQPVAENGTEEGRAANRRIEFRVLEGVD